MENLAAAFQIEYQDNELLVVDAPELGEGKKVRFKTKLSVKEMVSLGKSVGPETSVLVISMLVDYALFSLCLVDEEGNNVIPEPAIEIDEKGRETVADNWFDSETNGVLVRKLVQRADLRRRVLGGVDSLYGRLAEDSGDGDDSEKKT